MVAPTYEEVWDDHLRLSKAERSAFDNLQGSRAAYESAREDLDAHRLTANPEQRDHMEAKVLLGQTDVEKKTELFNQAQAAVAQLQLDHVEFAHALENNIPPGESLMERARPYIDKGVSAAVGLQMLVGATSGDPAALPSTQRVALQPPGSEHSVEIDVDGLDEALGRRNDHLPSDGESDVKGSGGPMPGEPVPKPSINEVTADGSATFGAQAFANEVKSSPQRTAANDNDPNHGNGKGPDGRGPSPPPSATAAALPANDNAQAPADAVSKQWVSDDQVASDFGRPLPPPPPPPPEQEQERKRTR